MTSTDDSETVERLIPAPPEKIFELLVDPSQHCVIDALTQPRFRRPPDHTRFDRDSSGDRYRFGSNRRERHTG